MAKTTNTARTTAPKAKPARSPALPTATEDRAARSKKGREEAREVEIDDDADDDDDDDSENGKREKRSDKAMLTVRVLRLIKASARIQRDLGDTFEDETQALADVLGKLSEQVPTLDDDWKRTRAASGGFNKTFDPGNIVQITEKRREAYVGLLEADELDELRVIKQVGSKCAVMTPSKAKLFLPVAHLRSAE